MSDRSFRDAEAWLAERGVRRDPIHLPTEPPQPAAGAEPGSAQHAGGTASVPEGAAEADSGTTAPVAPPAAPHVAEQHEQHDQGGSAASAPPVTAREAGRLAAASADETMRRADHDLVANRRPTEPHLEDEVADAVAFVRRSTANTPQAEGRVASKLRDRGWPDAVVEQAMARCRRTGLVDDPAMAAALVEEGRRKGHAPRRLRADLHRRGLADDVIAQALSAVEGEDPEAAAFAVAKEKAASLTGVSAETAFRRVVAHLARRGHPEGLARKVARAAVFDSRDPQRTAER